MERYTITVRDPWGTLLVREDKLTWERAEEIAERYPYTEARPYQVEIVMEE